MSNGQRENGEVCEARRPVLRESPPPLVKIVKVILAMFETNLFLQNFFFTFICKGYTKQRSRKQLYLLDKLLYNDARTLIRRVLNYSKRLGTYEVHQMAL